MLECTICGILFTIGVRIHSVLTTLQNSRNFNGFFQVMVQRRLLTPDFVNSIQPPEKGEQWIADTKVKGFGLRLFASGGQGKTFAIRVTNKEGTTVRRTFGVYYSSAFRFRLHSGHNELELGALLDKARSWARREIENLKHLDLDEELDREYREQVASHVRDMPLIRAAESLIKGLKAAGRKEAYRDGLFSILENIPAELSSKSLADISAEEMAKALVREEVGPGNIRKLRSLIGQIYKRAGEFGAGLWKFEEELSKHYRKRVEAYGEVRYARLRKLNDDNFLQVLARLKCEQDRWQQAMCILLYLEVGAPLNKVMRAEWRAIYEGYWYPYSENEKVYWFECREWLNEKVHTLLENINFQVSKSFYESLYLFPSTHTGLDNPISTIEPLWRDALKQCGLDYYPLRYFGMRFGRRRNNPSYAPSVLQQYGEMFRKAENAAELSKIVTERRKFPITSGSYKRSLALPQTESSVVG
jgi:hypothetical protein